MGCLQRKAEEQEKEKEGKKKRDRKRHSTLLCFWLAMPAQGQEEFTELVSNHCLFATLLLPAV